MSVSQPTTGRTRSDEQRLQLVRLLVVGGALALAALVIALNWGGGAPTPSPPGIPDPGPVTGWGLPITNVVVELAALLTIGSLLVPTMLLPQRHKEMRGPSVVVVHAVRWIALAWVASGVVLIVLTLSDIIAVPVQNLSVTDFGSFVWQVPTGRALAAQVVLALVVAFASRWVLSVAETTALLAISLLALVPPTLSGHSASSGAHDVAVVSLLVHIVAVSLWVGGLVALLWFTALRAKNVGYAVRRFSTLAAWCLAIVLVSGVINASVRIGSLDALFTTSYGNLVIVKMCCLIGLGLFGWTHRRKTLPPLDESPDATATWGLFTRIAALEVCLMAVTVGVAVALSRTPTPVGNVYTTPVESLLGSAMPPPPTAARYLFDWAPSGVGLAVVLFGSAFYIAGLVVMRRKGNRWPAGRTISWFLGLFIVGWATFGGLGLYSHVLFSAHMVSHMLLSMVAPIFLVLAAPVTLALRTLPGPRIPGERSPRGMLTAFLHSGFAKLVTNPILVTALFIFSLYGLYFTGLFDTLMTNHLGHAAMELHFLLIGSLFFYVLVGVDPSPQRLHPFARIGLLLIVMPVHAFFAVAIMSSDSVLGRQFFTELNRPYLTDLLHDQLVGASLSWSLGELPVIAVMIAIFVQWLRSDAREARRADRREALKPVGETDLDEYNRYLARLHAADQRAAVSRPGAAGQDRSDDDSV